MTLRSNAVLGALAATLLFIVLFSYSPDVIAQTTINPVFSSADTFSAPGFNSTIRFATNGSCTSITLHNGTWTFTGLRLGSFGSASNVSIVATDCNMTIYSVAASNLSARSVSLRYNTVGDGSQSVRFVDITKQTTSVEWSVIVPGSTGNRVWLSEGRNWNLMSDNTVVVHGVAGNVTVARYNLGAFQPSNQPFPFSHSITLITLGTLIVIVAAALVIKLARKP